ncbi:MAG: amidohydrolase family protein [Armatimonadota bacterium]
MIIDSHVHLHSFGDEVTANVDRAVKFADRMGIEKLVVSLGPQLRRQPTADELIEDNEYVMRGVQHNPDRIVGLVYASPNHIETSVELMEQYIENGPMRGVKMWICRHCSNPANDPIADYAGELDVPIQQHTWIKSTGNYPTESTPWDLLELAKRHPDTQFIMAHSGGNWEKGIRIIKDQTNIAIDVCGGNPEVGQTEYGVKYLGAQRVLYGSDAAGRSFASQLAKVTGADISDDDRRLILEENARRMFHL